MVGIVGGAVVLVAVAAGVSTLGLVWYLDRYRGSAGAVWLETALVAQAAVALVYAGALLVSDPVWRPRAEALVWIGMAWMGPPFLGFALDYTGRSAALRSWGFRAILAVPAATTAVAATYPYHDLLWRGFRVAPAAGLAGAAYAIGPWGYVVVGTVLVSAGIAVLLLVETILTYGPLYRSEAIAVGLSTLPPAAGLVGWLAGVGPYPAVNAAVPLLLPHVALDAYAFVGTQMFESNPTTRRAADRSAIDDLPTPVLVVDTADTVVECNAAAADLIGAPAAAVVGTPITDHLDLSFGPDGAPEEDLLEVASAGGRPRRLSVSATPLSDPAGTVVGRTVVLQDLTERLEREQQLDVLNRVLRHNLRNEMNVIVEYAAMIEEAAEAPAAEWAGTVREQGEDLVDIGDRAREFADLRTREVAAEPVRIETLLAEVVHEARPESGATVACDAAPATVETDPDVLAVLLRNLVDNAVEHAGDRPTVRVRGRREEGWYAIEVADDGPGIPEQELSVLERGTESALEHGSGLGLWIVTWSVDRLGGAIEFDAAATGTTVRVRVPAGEE